MSGFYEIKELWDEGAKFTFDDRKILKQTIDKILTELDKKYKYKDERLTDLFFLLDNLRIFCNSNIDEIIIPKMDEIIEKYIKIIDNYESLNNFERFGLIKLAIQNIIYDLVEK